MSKYTTSNFYYLFLPNDFSAKFFVWMQLVLYEGKKRDEYNYIGLSYSTTIDLNKNIVKLDLQKCLRQNGACTCVYIIIFKIINTKILSN